MVDLSCDEFVSRAGRLEADTATVAPITTTLPLTYAWQATGQTPITRSDNLTNTLQFSWEEPGQKTDRRLVDEHLWRGGL